MLLIWNIFLLQLSQSADCIDGEYYDADSNTCLSCEQLEPDCVLCSLNLLENGSFERPGVSGEYADFVTIPGWETDWWERIQLVTLGEAAYGGQVVDMALLWTGGSYRIWQTASTVQGNPYILRIYYSGHPGAIAGGNRALVYLNGSIVAELTTDVVTPFLRPICRRHIKVP